MVREHSRPDTGSGKIGVSQATIAIDPISAEA